MIRLVTLFGLTACAFDPTAAEQTSLTIENASSWSIATVEALACAGSDQTSLLADPIEPGATATVELDAGCYSFVATSAGDTEQWFDAKTLGGSAFTWRLTTSAAQAHEPGEPGCGGAPPP